MAAPAPIPNYSALLNVFFLREYINQFVNHRLSAEQQLEARMRLEYELDRIVNLQPGSAIHVLRLLQDALSAVPATEDLQAVVEWLLGFVITKDQQWQREVDTGLLGRYWEELPDRGARESIIEGILTIDYNRDVGAPWLSQICKLFGSHGKDESGKFTAKGNELLELLLREMFVSPSEADAIRLGHTITLSRFAGTVLRYSLANQGEEVPRELREAVLAMAGNIDTALRRELETTLLLR